MDTIVERSQILRALVKSHLVGYVSLAAVTNTEHGKYSLVFSPELRATGSMPELLECIEKCAGDVKSLQVMCEKAGLIKPEK